ncbi:Addiction module antidote [Bosea sp. LC85]|uniref:transcriptional regulator n=1 Tax=Bosea sp. LC85 TaxID=1502851 RepID=UPI0004E3220A|nr:transcriptional regulator [Bosea sp. LC85]KFC74503.1 Addiction module antidote [Bosea sp. LC85]
MVALKIRQFGNSRGVILPKEELDRMQVDLGDTVYLTRAPGGSRLTPYDPDFEAQMDMARRVMKKRRNALRELAK